MKKPVNNEKRSEFIKDLYALLDTHKNFIDNPDYEDYQGDAWEFVLDDMQKIYCKWIHDKE